ncbi:hypothetical protein KR100_15300 [Synechococcus sp. KORDI-100]|nr:hypothetical protein KR100_15300 [Synechococcus sp. KORDI-100]
MVKTSSDDICVISRTQFSILAVIRLNNIVASFGM